MKEAIEKSVFGPRLGIAALSEVVPDEATRARLELERVRNEAIGSQIKSALLAAGELVNALDKINSLGGEIHLSGEKAQAVLKKLAAGGDAMSSLTTKIRQGAILVACQGHS
jgi:hypothetical protein